MDLSMVAAAGSFAISERVLKPKATALFILGCVLAYDLTTKTHDVSSLRVYRGKFFVWETRKIIGKTSNHSTIFILSPIHQVLRYWPLP